jgi:multisubunit Na+/H+ antiporter MnhC subunit
VSSLDGHLITTVGTILILLILGGIFLFLARRILRIALKLALAMAIIFVLVVGAGLGWWRGWFSASQPSEHRQAGQTNQRVNTNRTRR